MFKPFTSIVCIFFLFAHVVFAAEPATQPAPSSQSSVTVVSCLWVDTQKVGYYVVSYGKGVMLHLQALPKKVWNDLMQRASSNPQNEVVKVNYNQAYEDAMREYELVARELDRLGCGQQILTSGVPITPQQLESIHQQSPVINPTLLRWPLIP